MFDEAVKLAPEVRPQFVRERCGPDESLCHEVLEQLKADLTADSLLDRPSGELPFPVQRDPMEGRLVGAYRLSHQIGRGGMGAVYLATRADDQFRLLVAIKIVKPGLDDGHLLRRFRNERQTLAALNHPNIVKLLDAGATEDGLPYLVMDYIEGQHIDEYCQRRNLSITERLELFRTVCAAVHYAHQNLVVHRDLKPRNILVTPDGVPKLLDFGIAKLLRPAYGADAGSLTRTGQPLTLAYASPEQIRGEPVTTASDVYALGVVLYELLTGHGPYKKTDSELELQQEILQKTPEKPSTDLGRGAPPAVPSDKEPDLRRRLSGDLDVIVLMALRKEPQRRYPSADQLSEDIRRHLENRPVIARQDTLGYRMSKFVARHRAGVAAGLATALALVMATVVSVFYARDARIERGRAEERLSAVRQLAHFVLFQLDDEVKASPTRAREALVGKALDYLERLDKEARGDPSLERYVIEGYLRIGDVQGNLYGPNVGNAIAARESYRKAWQIAEARVRADSGNAAARLDLARAGAKMGEILSLAGDSTEAVQHFQKARDVFQAWPASDADGKQAKLDLVRVLEKLGYTQLHLGHLAQARQSYQRFLEVSRERYPPDSAEARRARASYEQKVGEVLVDDGQPEEGLRMIDRALEIHRQLAAEDHSSIPARRAVATTLVVRAGLLAKTGRRPEALASYRSALADLEALYGADPENRQYQRDLSLIRAALGVLGQKEEARLHFRQALQQLEKLSSNPEASWYDHRLYAWYLLRTSFAEQRNPDAALRHALQAVQLTNRRDPVVLDTLALAYEANGDLKQAVEVESSAIALLSPGLTGHLPEELRENLASFKRKLAGKPAPPKSHSQHP